MSLKIVFLLALAIGAFQNMASSRSQQQEGTQSQKQKDALFAGPQKSDRPPAKGGVEILSDTMGVDFGPYLKTVADKVREHWYELIPESARALLMKKGDVTVEFAILKDGRTAGLKIVKPSGDDSLDRAAYGAIYDANPFLPLPNEFNGKYLHLRVKFYYNPDKNPEGPDPATAKADIQILSDNQGVDFGPYLQRELWAIKRHWYKIMPASAIQPKGDVTIEFTILKSGKVVDIKVQESSGHPSLDKAAFDAVANANPLDPLPNVFPESSIPVRINFRYNPEKEMIEPAQSK
jgi:TonB family protein